VHIPDGFLDAKTCLGTACIAGAGLAWVGRGVTARWSERTVPLMGVMSAFVFAGQMVNFPVAGGTSGHLLGGVLAAVLLGPAAGAMALSTVLVVQCLFFQDGGLTALGANVMNLSLVGVLGGYGSYRLFRRFMPGNRGVAISAAMAAWVSVVLASAACACELAASGTVPLRLVLPAMTVTHMIIGIGEALITASVVAFVLKVRPDLLYEETGPAAVHSWKAVAATGTAVALGTALLLAPLASTQPDGLEHLAALLGFEHKAIPVAAAPLAEYVFPWVRSPWVATALAGVTGTLLSLGVAWLIARGLARWLRRTRPS